MTNHELRKLYEEVLILRLLVLTRMQEILLLGDQ